MEESMRWRGREGGCEGAIRLLTTNDDSRQIHILSSGIRVSRSFYKFRSGLGACVSRRNHLLFGSDQDKRQVIMSNQLPRFRKSQRRQLCR